jgi:hypothetical protein
VGVDINGSSHSEAIHNYSARNQGGGFLVADDIGPSSDNLVGWNTATRNPGRLRRDRGRPQHGRRHRHAVPDTRTTGILAATASSVTGTLIANNHISDNHFGVFLEALSTVKSATVSGLGSDRFTSVSQHFKFVIAHV